MRVQSQIEWSTDNLYIYIYIGVLEKDILLLGILTMLIKRKFTIGRYSNSNTWCLYK